VRLEFGHPSFCCFGGEKVARYDSGITDVIKGIEFRPFTIHRDFHNYKPETFDLVQNFVLYHNAFYVPEKSEYQRVTDDGDIQTVARSEYQRVTDDGDIQTVARIERQKDNLRVLVDTHHLRDYLAANKCYLIRYHDHRRWSEEDISTYIEGDFASYYEKKDDSSNFELCLRTDIPSDNYMSSSRLRGKDVILPYNKPDKYHTDFFTGDINKRFSLFVVGHNDQGEEIEATCNERELSNYFTDRGTPQFLTPVFFSREVLGKYYQEPSRYNVSDSDLSCLNLWDLPIDITKEKLVQVWLGDLGRIPYKEQLHWRQFNVAPRGTITEHRWQRDFMAEPTDPIDSPIYYFCKAFEEIQKVSKAKFGSELFQELDEKDRHAYETLHLPLTEEWKEFDEQVQALAKVTVDSINVSVISHESGRKINGKDKNGKDIKGSIALLGAYLDKIGVKDSEIGRFLSPFHAIQSIRSAGSAHRKGSGFEKALKQFQLNDLTNHKKMEKLVVDLTDAIRKITEVLKQN
jgi:hypothetical protein